MKFVISRCSCDRLPISTRRCSNQCSKMYTKRKVGKVRLCCVVMQRKSEKSCPLAIHIPEMEAVNGVVMDPWKLDADNSNSSDLNMSFEDNFIDKVGNVGLPDSAEYIASLEKKLETLKSKKNKKDLVKSLEERHRSCMMNLLSGASGVDSEEEYTNLLLDQPVGGNHPLLRYVAPDKQALTLGELVELLKADQLGLDKEKDEGSESSPSQ